MLRAEQVRVIGGPTGPALGTTGPAGPLGLPVIGPTGIIGATGMVGKTGFAGPEGVYAALAGLIGRTGPNGSAGYPGPDGHVGRSSLVPGDDYIISAVNPDGYGPFYDSSAIGCKFRYLVKNDGASGTGTYVFVFFTAHFEDTAGAPSQFRVSVISGTGSAPDPGNYSAVSSVPTVLKPAATGFRFPVFCSTITGWGPRSNYATDYFPVSMWFDLAAVSLNPDTLYGSLVIGGRLTDIAATIFEVPM